MIVQEGTIGEALAENGKQLMEEIGKHQMGIFEREVINRSVGINTRPIAILDWNIIYI